MKVSKWTKTGNFLEIYHISRYPKEEEESYEYDVAIIIEFKSAKTFFASIITDRDNDKEISKTFSCLFEAVLWCDSSLKEFNYEIEKPLIYPPY